MVLMNMIMGSSSSHQVWEAVFHWPVSSVSSSLLNVNIHYQFINRTLFYWNKPRSGLEWWRWYWHCALSQFLQYKVRRCVGGWAGTWLSIAQNICTTILVLHFTPVIYISAVTLLEKKMSRKKPEIQSEQWNSTDV